LSSLQTKSTYTLDMRSEYGGAGLLPLWEDDPIKGERALLFL